MEKKGYHHHGGRGRGCRKGRKRTSPPTCCPTFLFRGLWRAFSTATLLLLLLRFLGARTRAPAAPLLRPPLNCTRGGCATVTLTLFLLPFKVLSSLLLSSFSPFLPWLTGVTFSKAAISYDTRDHKFTTFGTDAEAMRRLLDDMEYPLPFTLDEAGRPCEPRLVFSAVDDVLVEPLLQHLRQNKHKLLPSPSSPPAKELNDLDHEKTAIEGEEEDTVVGRYQCWLLHKTDEFQKVVPRDLPSGFYEGMTEENDVDLINETWTYRSATSKDNIRDCVIHRPTRCIRQQLSSSTTTNESNQLAQESGPICCWSLVRTDFQIGMTYTMPSCRRLGLAQRVLWWVAADLLAQQQERVQQMSPVLLATLRKRDDGAPVFPLTPFCYIHPENKASQAMVASLGFECLAHSSWIIA